jgi:hypothetical protein
MWKRNADFLDDIPDEELLHVPNPPAHRQAPTGTPARSVSM